MKHRRRSLLLLATMLAFPATSWTQENPWAAGHGYWSLPGTAYRKLYVTVRVTDRPTFTTYGVYYAMQFWTRFGRHGYVGLQRTGEDKEIAIFSIWGASLARGPAGSDCAAFHHEGDGYSCKIPYHWNPDRDYTLIVQRYITTTNFYWWTAYIKDNLTGSQTQVGRIRVPAGWGHLKGNTVNFIEHFGKGAQDCTNLKFNRAEFTKMRGLRLDGRDLGATPSSSKPGSGECRVSNINISGTSTTSFRYVFRAGETKYPLRLSNSYRGAAFLSTRSTEPSVSVQLWNGSAWIAKTLSRGTVVQLSPYSSTYHGFHHNGQDYRVHQSFVYARLSAQEWYPPALEWGFRPCSVVICDSLGLIDDGGQWWLRSAMSSSASTKKFKFGSLGDVAFMGDWDGDGVATPGFYRDGKVSLRNSNSPGPANVSFYFGNPGDYPLAGDFDGDGWDTVSLYRPSEARIYVINRLGPNGGGLGAADSSFYFGNPGDRPFVGDFNGDGIDTVGLHRQSTGQVFLRNSLTTGIADDSFIFGIPGDVILAGDWDGDGKDTVAAYRSSTARVYVKLKNAAGPADYTLSVGSFPGAVTYRSNWKVPEPGGPPGVR